MHYYFFPIYNPLCGRHDPCLLRKHLLDEHVIDVEETIHTQILKDNLSVIQVCGLTHS